MDFTTFSQEQQDKENLTTNIHTGHGGFPPVKVVEYMLSSMSDELLCKFPDNSAFDFDYTQSSIWSPLVPHPSNPSSPALPDLQKTLSFDDDGGEIFGGGEASGSAAVMVKKLTDNLKHKIADSCVFSCFQIHGKIGKKKVIVKRRRSRLGFEKLGAVSSDSGGAIADRGCSSPNRREGWKKVLKAASKQFKKTMKKKEGGGGGHLKLSNGVSDFYR
ncbi:hypothetical protein OSB04_004693 [Centaurea solstitialis]|uniref:Uncharacterized protein n=1 Tax=Centaurea solstitialis TaxID=347529 RepID=A0AA38TM49_9ASTR|nr:hypothetical protein OSB04_004693 [Centaurea solstitialis]